ncbi:hypothetical protein D7V94_16420 [Parablautia intestinalis]|uniref:Uncharacterized protein n=2 Tax=Parablautia intestinalis TaxID=2320100 RepID=A0A3A9AQD2_9FIRM|nr:hypothetical protein D7V94_16420 [Parablautia intestinalis]
MENAGHLTIRGLVPRAYYKKQKESGFLLDELAAPAARIPLNEKRLLSLEEFCGYVGGIGICTARKFVREIGAEIRIGGRCLVDRVKFDRWCDQEDRKDYVRVFIIQGLKMKTKWMCMILMLALALNLSVWGNRQENGNISENGTEWYSFSCLFIN